MQPDHMRHLPDPMVWIIQADRNLDATRAELARPVVGIGIGRVLREQLADRARLTAGAHEVYGHTPSRGDRGPNSAGAIAA